MSGYHFGVVKSTDGGRTYKDAWVPPGEFVLESHGNVVVDVASGCQLMVELHLLTNHRWSQCTKSHDSNRHVTIRGEFRACDDISGIGIKSAFSSIALAYLFLTRVYAGVCLRC